MTACLLVLPRQTCRDILHDMSHCLWKHQPDFSSLPPFLCSSCMSTGKGCSMIVYSQAGKCNTLHQCLPEGLRNGAGHQIVLKSEGGDVWHDAQLRWYGPNQLQPKCTVTHHRALTSWHLSGGLMRGRAPVCMRIGSSASMQGYTCSMATYAAWRCTTWSGHS